MENLQQDRMDVAAPTSARSVLAALIARLGGEAIACTPVSRRDLLVGTYRRRAWAARHHGWAIPLLTPYDLQAHGERLGGWAEFYLHDIAPHQREAIVAATAHVAHACSDGEIEVDPWDVIAWLDDLDPARRAETRAALQAGGFLPAREGFEVLSFVHSTEHELSLRLFVSREGFGDRCRHFLLRYFVDEDRIPALGGLFEERAADLWIEGNRVIFSTESGDAARALLAFYEMTAAARLAVAESRGSVAMFCEMPPRVGMLADMDRWGDVPLRHGVELFEVA